MSGYAQARLQILLCCQLNHPSQTRSKSAKTPLRILCDKQERRRVFCTSVTYFVNNFGQNITRPSWCWVLSNWSQSISYLAWLCDDFVPHLSAVKNVLLTTFELHKLQISIHMQGNHGFALHRGMKQIGLHLLKFGLFCTREERPLPSGVRHLAI